MAQVQHDDRICGLPLRQAYPSERNVPANSSQCGITPALSRRLVGDVTLPDDASVMDWIAVVYSRHLKLSSG